MLRVRAWVALAIVTTTGCVVLPRRTWHEVKRAPIGPSQLVAIEGLDGTSPRRAGTGTPASGAIDHSANGVWVHATYPRRCRRATPVRIWEVSRDDLEIVGCEPRAQDPDAPDVECMILGTILSPFLALPTALVSGLVVAVRPPRTRTVATDEVNEYRCDAPVEGIAVLVTPPDGVPIRATTDPTGRAMVPLPADARRAATVAVDGGRAIIAHPARGRVADAWGWNSGAYTIRLNLNDDGTYLFAAQAPSVHGRAGVALVERGTYDLTDTTVTLHPRDTFRYDRRDDGVYRVRRRGQASIYAWTRAQASPREATSLTLRRLGYPSEREQVTSGWPGRGDGAPLVLTQVLGPPTDRAPIEYEWSSQPQWRSW